jgi:hypothetical protein
MDLDNIKKQEKARARKKRYLQIKKNKKQKLEMFPFERGQRP